MWMEWFLLVPAAAFNGSWVTPTLRPLSAVLPAVPGGIRPTRWENLAPSATRLPDTSERRSPRQSAGLSPPLQGSRWKHVFHESCAILTCNFCHLLSVQWQQTVPKPLVKQQQQQEEELRKPFLFCVFFFPCFWAPTQLNFPFNNVDPDWLVHFFLWAHHEKHTHPESPWENKQNISKWHVNTLHRISCTRFVVISVDIFRCLYFCDHLFHSM